VTVSAAVSKPMILGVNTTLTEQLDPTAIIDGQSLVSEKSALFVAMPVNARSALPELVTTTLFGALALPIFVVGNARVFVLNVTAGA